MSIFAIITDLHLLQPPEWYAEFTERFLSRPKPHVTLIQPRIMDEMEAFALYRKLSADLVSMQDMLPIRTRAQGHIPFFERTGCMIQVEDQRLRALQSFLHLRMPTTCSWYFPPAQQYEEQFVPHLTLADQIPAADFDRVCAQYDLAHLSLDVEVRCVLATLPPDFSEEESKKESNYHLMVGEKS